ncbi:MAG: diadenylate cyclase [Deltaproteobacteria bacterium]|nr:diadenylate cyclase [Deltaproteobacteria bacterium]
MQQKIKEQLLNVSISLCKELEKAVLLFYYQDVGLDCNGIKDIGSDIKKIIVLRESEDIDLKELKDAGGVISVPSIKITRINKVKLALMIALSSGLLKMDETVVCLLGGADGQVDSLFCIDMATENEFLFSARDIKLGLDIKGEIFEKVLSIALDLASMGREGRVIGTIFMLGDAEKVMSYSRQMIFNPFKGYAEDERNILTNDLSDTLKEYSLLDGAIVIDGGGVIVSAGAYLASPVSVGDLPKGLGSRHMAAASMTASTNAVAIVVSASTGDVSIFKKGKMIMRIERSS